MSSTSSRLGLLIAGILVCLPFATQAEVPEHEASWDDKCPAGFQWSRGIAGCAQAECPEGASRTYTYYCNCGEAWNLPKRTCYGGDVPGLVTSCVEAGALCPGETPVAEEPVVVPEDPPLPEDIEDLVDSIEAGSSPAPECSAAKHEVTRDDGYCDCAALYQLNLETDACEFVGARGVSLDTDSLYDFQVAIDGLGPEQSTVFVGVDVNGKEIRVGLLRLSDGTIVFTKDGVHFTDTLKDVVKPTLWTRTKRFGGDVWKWVRGLFGVGKYTGKNTADDPTAQEEGQQKLNAATLAFAHLQRNAKDPYEHIEELRETSDGWLERAKALLGEKYDELILGEIEKQTGVPVKLIKNILAKDVDGISDDMIDAVKGAMTNAPAQAVIILAHEMPKASFASGASVYMSLRATKTPEEILAGMITSEYPELEVAEMKGAGFQYSRAILFAAYEEAYQRYRLHASLGGK